MEQIQTEENKFILCRDCQISFCNKDYKSGWDLGLCRDCNFKYELPDFLNFDKLQKYIRKNGFKDFFKVDGIIYTQQEYDIDGKYISYGNKRLSKGFIVNTKDRYNLGTQDAEIEFLDEWYLRNDISYFD